jgi:hypothetical protein
MLPIPQPLLRLQIARDFRVVADKRIGMQPLQRICRGDHNCATVPSLAVR